MYVPLDVNFPDDDKIEAVGLAGSGLYAQALCVAKRTLSDGRVSLVKLHRMGADDVLIAACVRVDLFRVQPDDPDAVWISSFLDHNDDAATVESKRSSDAQRKRSARRKRPASVQADAPTPSESVRTLEVEIEPETEVEVEVDPASVISPLTVVEPEPSLDVEQTVNRAVGLLANLRAVGGNNPGALARHIGENLPDHERAELRDLIVGGMDVRDAAAALADPLRGLNPTTGTPADPAAIARAAEQARKREEATAKTLADMADAATARAPMPSDLKRSSRTLAAVPDPLTREASA